MKQIERPRKSEIKPKNPVFGIPLEQVPFEQDGEFCIPKPLLLLKKSLVKFGGLTSEGIFRLAGSEITMKQVKLELDLGIFVESDDIHSCATLIKVPFISTSLFFLFLYLT